MSRNVTSTLEDAMNDGASYDFLVKAEVYPTKVFFPDGTITSDNPIGDADPVGINDDPLRQDFDYDYDRERVVTFWADGALKYAKEGSASVVTTTISSSVKPGILEGLIAYYDEIAGEVKLATIDHDLIDANNTTPFAIVDSYNPSHVVSAIHWAGDAAVLICEDGGGFVPVIVVQGGFRKVSPTRFVFPMIAEWDGSGRSMEDLATHSAAAKLGNRYFVYMSDAHDGTVKGIYYDIDTDTWSDIFTAIPTDLSVSLCEFRVTNAFEYWDRVYLVGQFNRTDFFGESQPYTLVCDSREGKVFAVGKHNIVSNNGYRMLVRTNWAAQPQLVMAGSNRICTADATWLFLGNDDDDVAPRTLLPDSEFVNLNDSGGAVLNIDLRGGAEEYVDHVHIQEGSRLKLYAGYKTTAGDEYVLYSTYIINAVNIDRANGSRSTKISAMHEGQWKTTGLSMPFYAEITGLNGTFSNMSEENGKLYIADFAPRVETSFWVDVWPDLFENVSGLDLQKYTAAASPVIAYVVKPLKDKLGTQKNPRLSATSIDVRLYGWSRTHTSGAVNPLVGISVITCDEDGDNEVTTNVVGTQRWPKTWPNTVAGTHPISITVSGLTVGKYIKKLGFHFTVANDVYAIPARIEVLNGVEVFYDPPNAVGWSTDNLNGDWLYDVSFGNGFETKKYMKAKQNGLPCIMFAQKPYNAFNFSISAKFDFTFGLGTTSTTNFGVPGVVAGYPVACGLVGLAKDSENYICARYNAESGDVELLKYRDGIPTLLEDAAPGFTIDLDSDVTIRFDHRDGLFSVYMLNTATEEYVLVLSYEWQEADGFMTASTTAAMKCGIYGLLDAPKVKALVPWSYSVNENGMHNSTAGIAVDMLSSLSGFTGSPLYILTGDKVYAPSSVIAHPTTPQGPYRIFRIETVVATGGFLDPGFGYELFDWNGSASAYAGKFFSIESGYIFAVTETLWQENMDPFGGFGESPGHSNSVWIFTEFSENYFLSSIEKAYVTGGFSVPGVHHNEGGFITAGEMISKWLGGGALRCHWFSGAGGELTENTVAGLVETICDLAGAKANFPGDILIPSQVVNGTYEMFADAFSESIDMYFETEEPESFDVRINIKIKPDNYPAEIWGSLIDDDTHIILKFEYSSGNYLLSVISHDSGTVMYTKEYAVPNTRQRFRIFFHENAVTVFQSGRWIASINFDELIYDQSDSLGVFMITTSAVTFENLRLRDLSDYREAVYIDLETDAQSAISSVIQERPVEVVPQPDGSISFIYNSFNFILDNVTIERPPLSHQIIKQIPPNLASDAIVYGSKKVKTLQFKLAIEVTGFLTRLFRFPNLDVGMIEAAQRSLVKLYEQRERHIVSIRPRLDAVMGDIVSFEYDIVELDKNVACDVIIENTTLSVRNQQSKQVEFSMEARGYVSDYYDG